MSVLSPARKQDYFASAFAPPPAADIPAVTVFPGFVVNSDEQLIREARTVASGPADLAGDTHFRYDGTLVLDANNSLPATFVSSAYLPGGNGNGQNALYQNGIRTIGSPISRLKIKSRPGTTATGFRISINGAWVTIPVMRFTGLTAGGGNTIQLDWATKARRTVRWEDSGGTGFGGMAVALGATLTRPSESASPIRFATLGDSYTGGAGNPPDGAGRMETYANYVAKLVGATSFINFGIGGSG